MKEVALLFLKLGFSAFGGPAAHVALLEQEVVVRRKWLSRERFMKLMSVSQLIPGPNSTELAIHIGYERAKVPGLFIAGFCFICPAVLLTILLAVVYVKLGTVPAFAPLLAGLKPVCLVLIAVVFLRFTKKVLHKNDKVRPLSLVLFCAAAVAGFMPQFSEIVILLSAGFIGWASGLGRKGSLVIEPITLLGVFLVFLKIGAVLYGSGYLLISFLETYVVEQRGWIDAQQLLDAIAVGQITPGPLLSTSAFVGYLSLGPLGAVVAAVGIFLPSFLFVLAIQPVLSRLENSAGFSRFLDGVLAASVALIGVVCAQLLPDAIPHWSAAIIAGIAGFFFYGHPKINPVWVLAGGAVLGKIFSLLFQL